MSVGGTEKSWAELEQAELVYPNGMNCNYTCPRCSLRLNILSRSTCYLEEKKCQFEGNETGA